MLMTAQSEPRAIAAEDLAPIRALYEEGLCLRAPTIGPGPWARWSAGGARRRGSWRAAWRPTSVRRGWARLCTSGPGARTRRIPRRASTSPSRCCSRRGPLRTWEFLREVGPLAGATERIRGYWLSMHAIVLGQFRDFDAAESWLARADEVSPGSPWLLVQRASLLAMEDRYDDALAAAREALERRPWYRSAVQQAAHLLQLLDRDEEAESLLAVAAEKIESSGVVAQLGVLQAEMGRHAEARRTWDRFADTFPLIDTRTRKWLAGRRSDAAYECGDIAVAAAPARECGDPFFTALAPRLESPDAEVRRVQLGVGFVRQHHQTCAPATLAAVSRFWDRPADHLELAAEICYDGTPDHLQRSWAGRNGYVAREFTVTWEAALRPAGPRRPLHPGDRRDAEAHLQAVVGYDCAAGDATDPRPDAPLLGRGAGPGAARPLSVHRATRDGDGPRSSGRTCSTAWSCPRLRSTTTCTGCSSRCAPHDREGAEAACATLCAEAPGHRLALHARCVLAHYDADPAELLAGVEAQLALFPDDVNLRLSQLGCLRMLGRRDERVALYRELCGRPDPDPLLRRQYAQELLADAREHPEVVRLVKRALRARPSDPAGLATLADVAADAGRMSDTVELYRLAACLDDKDEGLARSYFQAARHLHREAEALRFLEGRFRRLGARSAWPGARSTGRSASSSGGRRRSRSWTRPCGSGRRTASCGCSPPRPTPRTASSIGPRSGSRPRGGSAVAATGCARRPTWPRSGATWPARWSSGSGCSRPSRRPLTPTAPWRRRLAETRGRAAAVEHFAVACERFPHNYALNQAWIEWLRADGPAAVEPAVRRILAIHPADAWARRELALALARQGRHDEAGVRDRPGHAARAGQPERGRGPRPGPRAGRSPRRGPRAPTARPSADRLTWISPSTAWSRPAAAGPSAPRRSPSSRRSWRGRSSSATACSPSPGWPAARWTPTRCWRRSARPARPGPTSGMPGRR